MPGIRAEVTCRQLPDAWADPCPTCGQPRRWLSLVTKLGTRTVAETIVAYCADHWEDT